MNGTSVYAFGPLLRSLRLKRGLTQEGLAERARLSVEAVSALERGSRTSPQRQTLALLVKALQLDREEQALLLDLGRPRRVRSSSADLPVSGIAPTRRLTSFVGRKLEVQDVLRLLGQYRGVTLVGAGGVGKSRLAAEAASAFGAEWKLPVSFVELAPLADRAAIIPALCDGLRVREERGVAREETLAAVLAADPRLLVLDDCEQLVEGVAQCVAGLLQTAPHLRILSTSREALGVEGELVYRVMPLPLGQPFEEQTEPSPAAQLFRERAATAAPDLVFDDESLRLVETIAAELDGIPLAIELAAARSDIFSLTEIAEGLRNRFRFLTKAPRNAASHHRTLREMLEWSFERLTATERLVLERLTIFRGSFTRRAAEHIVADDVLTDEDVFASVARLCDVSLLTCERGVSTRYGMLKTIRQFASECCPLSEHLGDRHARYYLEEARAAEGPMRSGEQQTWVERLGRSREDILAALEWASEREDLRDAALAAVAGLGRYWLLRGHLSEARSWYATFLDAPARSLESSSFVMAACSAALIAYNEHTSDVSYRYAARALEAARGVEDEWTRLYAELVYLNMRFDLLPPAVRETAEARLRELQQRAKDLGEPWLEEIAVWGRGTLAMIRGDGCAEGLFLEAVAIALQCGDRIAIVTSNIAVARYLVHDAPSRALFYAAEAASAIDADNSGWLASAVECAAAAAMSLERPTEAAYFLACWKTLTRRAGRLRGAVQPRVLAPDAVASWIQTVLDISEVERHMARAESASINDVVAAMYAVASEALGIERKELSACAPALRTPSEGTHRLSGEPAVQYADPTRVARGEPV